MAGTGAVERSVDAGAAGSQDAASPAAAAEATGASPNRGEAAVRSPAVAAGARPRGRGVRRRWERASGRRVSAGRIRRRSPAAAAA